LYTPRSLGPPFQLLLPTTPLGTGINLQTKAAILFGHVAACKPASSPINIIAPVVQYQIGVGQGHKNEFTDHCLIYPQPNFSVKPTPTSFACRFPACCALRCGLPVALGLMEKPTSGS